VSENRSFAAGTVAKLPRNIDRCEVEEFGFGADIGEWFTTGY